MHANFSLVGNCVYRAQFQKHNLKGDLAPKSRPETAVSVVFDGSRQSMRSMKEALDFAYGKVRAGASVVYVESNGVKRAIKGAVRY